jgi:hypothetical protein
VLAIDLGSDPKNIQPQAGGHSLARESLLYSAALSQGRAPQPANGLLQRRFLMRINRFITTLITLIFLGTSLLAPAQAAMIDTQNYMQSVDREANLAIIDLALLRDDVQQQLTKMGVSQDDARLRVANLPDQDVARLAEKIETMPAGGGLLALVGAVFIVLLILEVTGVIDIFSKID